MSVSRLDVWLSNLSITGAFSSKGVRLQALESASAMPDLKDRRIMVVEDQYLIADDLCRALVAAGAEVIGPFATEAKAFSSLDAGSIDAAVLDLDLNGRSSLDLAKRLTALNIPFVIASGFPEGTIPADFAAVQLWSKPYDPTALAAALPQIFV